MFEFNHTCRGAWSSIHKRRLPFATAFTNASWRYYTTYIETLNVREKDSSFLLRWQRPFPVHFAYYNNKQSEHTARQRHYTTVVIVNSPMLLLLEKAVFREDTFLLRAGTKVNGGGSLAIVYVRQSGSPCITLIE